MPDTDSMNVAELEAHLATVDDVDTLQELRLAEEDGQKRKGAFDAIDSRIAELEGPSSNTIDPYELEPDTTYVVGHPDGEVEFKTDEDGKYTPTNEREAWALNELGVKPGKE